MRQEGTAREREWGFGLGLASDQISNAKQQQVQGPAYSVFTTRPTEGSEYAHLTPPSWKKQ